MWAFGDGDYGKLGLGNSTAKSTPQVVEALQNVGVAKVCCGTQFSVVLTKDGCVYSFGQGSIRLLVYSETALLFELLLDCLVGNFFSIFSQTTF